jgi:hypothetical protein
MTGKQTKNRLLAHIGRAIAELRIALEDAEDGELPDESAILQEEIDSLIDLSNQVEGL